MPAACVFYGKRVVDAVQPVVNLPKRMKNGNAPRESVAPRCA
jgi:hypothetical protein